MLRHFCFSDYIRTLIAYTAFYVFLICSSTVVFVVQYLNGIETLISCLIYTVVTGLFIGFMLVLALVYIVKTHPYKKSVEVEDDDLMMDDLNVDESLQVNPQNEVFAHQPLRSRPISIPGASRVTRIRSPSKVCTDPFSSNDCWVDDDISRMSMTIGSSGDSMLVNASDAASSSKEANGASGDSMLVNASDAASSSKEANGASGDFMFVNASDTDSVSKKANAVSVDSMLVNVSDADSASKEASGASINSMLVNVSDTDSVSKEADEHQVLYVDCSRSAETNQDFWTSGARIPIRRETALAKNEDSMYDIILDSLNSENELSELLPLLHKRSSMQLVQFSTEEDFISIEEKPQ